MPTSKKTNVKMKKRKLLLVLWKKVKVDCLNDEMVWSLVKDLY